MIGNGVMWSLMIPILTKLKQDGHSRKRKHTIKGDVLTIEDTFSLMAGRDLKLSSFVELGSLCLYAGWGYPTVNMPSAHCILRKHS